MPDEEEALGRFPSFLSSCLCLTFHCSRHITHIIYRAMQRHVAGDIKARDHFEKTFQQQQGAYPCSSQSTTLCVLPAAAAAADEMEDNAAAAEGGDKDTRRSSCRSPAAGSLSTVIDCSLAAPRLLQSMYQHCAALIIQVSLCYGPITSSLPVTCLTFIPYTFDRLLYLHTYIKRLSTEAITQD